ncbi:MAG: hypothetical protein BGO76_06490 [Caedibacter sp. 38-128]|nr:MAG: hypothetical protein BGO76_06490 [Caedibacter sp. 38-128]
METLIWTGKSIKWPFQIQKDDKFHISSHGIIGGGLLEYNHMVSKEFLVGIQLNAKWFHLNGKVENFNHIPLNLFRVILK